MVYYGTGVNFVSTRIDGYEAFNFTAAAGGWAMALIVQKYGGTSVGSVERIKAVAERLMQSRAAGNDVIAVVSAMAGETNRLFAIASELCDRPDLRETDVLVATGEQVSAALLAIRLHGDGPAGGFVSGSSTAHLHRLQPRPGADQVNRLQGRVAGAQAAEYRCGGRLPGS